MRIFLQYFIPFILPTIIYFLWVLYFNRRAKSKGTASEIKFSEGPWHWLVGAGAALVVITLTAFALTTGEEPNTGRYNAPRMENGIIVPHSYD